MFTAADIKVLACLPQSKHTLSLL